MTENYKLEQNDTHWLLKSVRWEDVHVSYTETSPEIIELREEIKRINMRTINSYFTERKKSYAILDVQKKIDTLLRDGEDDYRKVIKFDVLCPFEDDEYTYSPELVDNVVVTLGKVKKETKSIVCSSNFPMTNPEQVKALFDTASVSYLLTMEFEKHIEETNLPSAELIAYSSSIKSETEVIEEVANSYIAGTETIEEIVGTTTESKEKFMYTSEDEYDYFDEMEFYGSGEKLEVDDNYEFRDIINLVEMYKRMLKDHNKLAYVQSLIGFPVNCLCEKCVTEREKSITRTDPIPKITDFLTEDSAKVMGLISLAINQIIADIPLSSISDMCSPIDSLMNNLKGKFEARSLLISLIEIFSLITVGDLISLTKVRVKKGKCKSHARRDAEARLRKRNLENPKEPDKF